jgi:hypothetical protein
VQIYLWKLDFADECEEMVNVVRVAEIQLWGLKWVVSKQIVHTEGGTYIIYPFDICFTLEGPDKFRQNNTISKAILQLNNPKFQFFSQTPLYPLLGFSDVTQILIGLKEMSLFIGP